MKCVYLAWWPAGCPSCMANTLALGITCKLCNQILSYLLCIIGLRLSLTFTLTGGHNAISKQSLLALFSCRLFDWSGLDMVLMQFKLNRCQLPLFWACLVYMPDINYIVMFYDWSTNRILLPNENEFTELFSLQRSAIKLTFTEEHRRFENENFSFWQANCENDPSLWSSTWKMQSET